MPKTTTDVEAEEFHVETASSGGDTQAVPESTPEAVENTSPVDPEEDTIQSLLERIALFEQQVSSYEEEFARLEKENAVLLERQFSLDKIKDDNAAILFYTGFPTYEALMSFYHYVEPKLKKKAVLERRKAIKGKSALPGGKQKQAW